MFFSVYLLINLAEIEIYPICVLFRFLIFTSMKVMVNSKKDFFFFGWGGVGWVGEGGRGGYMSVVMFVSIFPVKVPGLQ